MERIARGRANVLKVYVTTDMAVGIQLVGILKQMYILRILCSTSFVLKLEIKKCIILSRKH